VPRDGAQQEVVPIQQFVRVNQKIRAREVRTVDHDGKQVGVLPIQQALALAVQRGLDLVEVAPQANPPVCRIMDFGKYKYEQTKREKEARKHQHATKLKEIKLRLNIDPHDYQIKLDHMREFLYEGMRVKVTLQLRGRENAHPELGDELMQKVLKDMQSITRCEMPPRRTGRAFNMMLAPAKGLARKPGTAPKPVPDEPDDELEDEQSDES
jgi:translation initiation factor IF-3